MKLLLLSSLSVLSCLLMNACQFVDPDAQISLPSVGGNPLDLAGYRPINSTNTTDVAESMVSADGAYHVGDYVEVAQPETPLYSQSPRAGAIPKKLLEQGVVLNVLGLNGNFMHVQNENGDTGYVSLMRVLPQGLLTVDLPISDIDVAEVD